MNFLIASIVTQRYDNTLNFIIAMYKQQYLIFLFFRLVTLAQSYFVRTAEQRLYRLRMNLIRMRKMIQVIRTKKMIPPPKVDKVAFRMAYEAIPDNSKLRLSTDTIVEDVLFEFAKDMDYEQ